ncbi:DNA mismatch repair protein Msh3 [Dipodascopsis tothii]|uniref:DNA mismatch repair protein Msh3 n=1 Tax=Dipodascopsis tothii TaxID=44089 RepID=UPI0034CEBA00
MAAGSSKKSGGQQATLSSFFARAPGPAAEPRPPKSVSSSPTRVLTEKRTSENTDGDAPAKRAKTGPEPEAAAAAAAEVPAPDERAADGRPAGSDGSGGPSGPSESSGPDVPSRPPRASDLAQFRRGAGGLTASKRAELHQAFRKKLVGPDALSFGEPADGDVVEADADDAVDDDDEAEAAAALRTRFAAKPGKAARRGKKLTPLEQQVVDIKRANRDTILAVEVGYKYKFFGEDARIASKALNIVLIPGRMSFDDGDPRDALYDKFGSSSVPIHRVYIHVKRLIEQGHKVGIVRQTETAALKAAGSNKSGPFGRSLVEVYTKGTFVDELKSHDAAVAGTGYVLGLCEAGGGTDGGVTLGLLAIQPATGDVVYEELADGLMRAELETRLLHLQPCEIVLVGAVSAASVRVVDLVAGSQLAGGSVRVERVAAADDAGAAVAAFFEATAAAATDAAARARAARALDAALGLPPAVVRCLAAMIAYLREFGLEHVFDLAEGFADFRARHHMLLNANVLHSLEIYTNQTDHGERGSLMWVLDHTYTRFGRRLLRKWVGQPLTDRERLEERLAAVDELKGSRSPHVERLCGVLAKMPDLERGLVRIHYGRCTRAELLAVLRALDRLGGATEGRADAFAAPALAAAFGALPAARPVARAFLEAINADAAAKNDGLHFFRADDDHPAIADEKLAILSVETELERHLDDVRRVLRKPAAKYAAVSGIDCLIEVRNAELRAVPANWIKISGTRSVSRFHTPTVIALLREREQRREALAAACDAAFRAFLAGVAARGDELRAVVAALAYLDAVLSLAAVAALPGYVRPAYVDAPCVRVVGGRHPMAEQAGRGDFVPNDTALGGGGVRTLVLTGPNMGGKSSYTRQVALIAIMGQIGSYVPAESATLGMLDAVYSRMGAYDNLMAGESTFMVELSETAAIMRAATPRSLVLLDEIGRGTGTVDGMAIAHAVLAHFVADVRALTLFVTHYPLLCAFAAEHPAQVANCYMDSVERPQPDGSVDVTFLYRVVAGVARGSYGLNVARLAGVPADVVARAGRRAAGLEAAVRERAAVAW